MDMDQSPYKDEDNLYSRTEPNIEEERRTSIERCLKLNELDYQINQGRTVVPDEEVEQELEKLRRGEYELDPSKPYRPCWETSVDWEEVTEAMEAQQEQSPVLQNIPAPREFVLARNGRLMYRSELQSSLEKQVRNELGVPEPWRNEATKIAWHKQQLARLQKADAAPRCEHLYADGTKCRAPKLKQGRQCYAHTRMTELRPREMKLLALEDANSVMLNLMQIQRALVDGAISEKSAALLLYTQRLGLVALKQLTFKETNPNDMVKEITLAPTLPETKRNEVETQKTEPKAEEKSTGTVKAEASDGKSPEEPERAEKSESAKEENGNAGVECAKSFKFGVAGLPGMGVWVSQKGSRRTG